MKRAYLLFSCLLLIGCATVGTKIDGNKVSQIKEGVTTKSGVVELLGKPQSVTLTSDGKTIMMYQYARYSPKASTFIPVVNIFSSGGNMNTQITQVLIGKDDKVEKLISNDNESDIKAGIIN